MEENGIHGKKWPSSDGKGDIILYTIDSCMHDWPIEEKYGIDATEEIWNFLKIHGRTPKPIVTTIDKPENAGNFKLYQNYPNPFSNTTHIKYYVKEPSVITIKIYNVTGQEIAVLINEFQTVGEHIIIWRPMGLTGGVYFLSIQSDTSFLHSGKSYSETKKLIVL